MHARCAPAGALVAVVALLAGACTDDPEPKFGDPTGPPSTSSEPATPTPSEPVEPPFPEVANELTNAGAEAFVAYYWRQVNFAQATGDVGGLEALALPGCDRCAAGSSAIARVYQRGGQIRGGAYATSSPRARAGSAGPVKLAEVRVLVRNGRQTVTGAGDLNDVFPSGETRYSFVLGQEGGRWLVTDFRALS